MKSIWQTLRSLFQVLPRDAKPFYIWYSIVTGLLAFLDTAALGLIVLTVTPLVSGTPLTLPIVGELPQSSTPWVVLMIAALFVAKGIGALLLHWRATRRFASYELLLGDQIFARYMVSSWERRSLISTAELTRMVDSSVGNASRGFLLPLSQVPGNALTFLAALTILVVAEPVTALIAFVYLSVFSVVMNLSVSRRSRAIGVTSRKYSYRVATIMTEMVDALKEVTLRGKLAEAGRMISKNRAVATRARADLAFITVVPRYAFEAALIGGLLLIGGSSLLLNGPSAAVVSVALFAASGFRMIPAMNAVQASLTAASSNEVYAQDVIREVREQERSVDPITTDVSVLAEDPQALVFKDVTFSYDSAGPRVLDNLSLRIPFGSSLAIVGPSGAGKSTLIDILLGLSIPTEGLLSIDDVPLSEVLSQWRGRVGYVPQRVALFDGTIAQNVALTWESDYDPDRVRTALALAHVDDIAARGRGIDERIGERGSAISGGQQQRLGIARALYSDPLVLVMDEATSALDTATESRIVRSLDEFKGQITFITVAHRLATIRHYDQICYLDAGQILGMGTFDEVVEAVPAFRAQAELAGLIHGSNR